MKFLDHPPRYLFFTGKGGVGKTSLACASAVELARAGKRVLLVSTDPASNVGQVFGCEIGNRVWQIDAVTGLSALEIDPQAAAQAYRDRIVGPVRGVLPDEVVRSIEEQLSGACTTEIAAFDEFTGLLTDDALTGGFDHVVFDTAPTGHTIRLLQLPGAWSGFLDQSPGGASCLGPLSGLEKQRERYRAAVAALADPVLTRLVLVARAQASTLREVARTALELAGVGLHQPHLVVNGVLREHDVGDDVLARAVRQREQRALADMPAGLLALPRDEMPLLPFNLVGLPALEAMLVAARDGAVNPGAAEPEDRGATVRGPSGTEGAAADAVSLPSLAGLVDQIAADGHGLVMLMGKGGVGKTTLAAAVAVALARRGLEVHLTTSDPAAHLTETLDGSLPHLSVSRIDPHAETERYRDHVLETKGRHLDAQGRALLEEDLRSPCTEEIAVFQAFSRIIREAGRKFVIMDTAPTGHTLLLLDATGAYHREIARHMEDSGVAHYTTPMMQLQDPTRTKVLIVTLAETTPVLEAARQQDDLRRAGIEPWAWVINNSLAATATTSPLLRRRAIAEWPQIETVRGTLATRTALVALQAGEPHGVERLSQLADGVDAVKA